MKYIRWAFWSLAYCVLPRPTDFDAVLKKTERTWRTWRVFKPSAWYNDGGKEWEVYFTQERCYTRRVMLQCEIHIGMETGKVVGVDMPVCWLNDAAKEKPKS